MIESELRSVIEIGQSDILDIKVLNLIIDYFQTNLT